MKKKKKKYVLQVDDVICDVCCKSCKKTCDIESATLCARWGYDSKKDGDFYDIDLCEDCFDKVIDFLNKIASCSKDKANLSPIQKFAPDRAW